MFKNELLKTYLKLRTYIGFIAITVIVPLIMLGLNLRQEAMEQNITRGLSSDFMVIGNLMNGYFATQIIMNGLWVHIPFLISLVAGDMLAGEATGGTFRLMLIRPASRTRVLLLKYATTLFYTMSLVLFLGVLSVGLGLLVFGGGDLLIPGRSLVIIPRADVPVHMLMAFGLAIWSMWCVASLAFLFSSLVENSIGPIIGTMAVIIVLIVISQMPVELFSEMRPYFFTTYLNVWQKVLTYPIEWNEVLPSAAILGGHSIGFYLLTWYIFVRKDILS
jgi:ABC-2 type transport system permease protein